LCGYHCCGWDSSLPAVGGALFRMTAGFTVDGIPAYRQAGFNPCPPRGGPACR